MITLQAYPTKAIAIVKTKAIARKIQQYYDGCFTIDFEWHMQHKVCYDMLMITSSPAPLLTRFHTSLHARPKLIKENYTFLVKILDC